MKYVVIAMRPSYYTTAVEAGSEAEAVAIVDQNHDNVTWNKISPGPMEIEEAWEEAEWNAQEEENSGD